MVAILSGVKLIEGHDKVLSAHRRRKNGFEPHTISLWRMLSARGKTMVDVGAYTGFYSILARLEGSQNVVAYEPNPVVSERLRANSELNGTSIRIRQVALSDNSGSACLRGKRGLTSGGSIAADGDLIAEVKTERLDDQSLGRVYAMKIDVERAECAVIRGGLGVISEYKPHLLIEALEGAEELDDLLRPLGYAGRTLDRGMYYYRCRA